MINKEIVEELKHIKDLALLQAKNYLNVDDMCNYTGLSKAIIYRKMKEKALPFSKPSGKMAFFKKSDVDEWLGSNRIASASELEEQAARYCVKH